MRVTVPRAYANRVASLPPIRYLFDLFTLNHKFSKIVFARAPAMMAGVGWWRVSGSTAQLSNVCLRVTLEPYNQATNPPIYHQRGDRYGMMTSFMTGRHHCHQLYSMPAYEDTQGGAILLNNYHSTAISRARMLCIFYRQPVWR